MPKKNGLRKIRTFGKKEELKIFDAFNQLKSYHQKLFAIVLAIALILFWRGIWGLTDLYLFPDNLFLSYLVSALFGIIVLFFTHYIIKGLIE